ncbi:MAG: DsbA family oxidoreductase [Nannocystaceae bacterium]|nr:DsbA family oxidoreductase [Nannocystaceae bacterium]
MNPVKVEIWSDVACPWCWVGKRHLEQAAASFERPVEIRWRAFELDSSAPKELDTSIDYVDRLARKYGKSRDGAQQMIDRMTEVGRQRGLDFRFDRARPGNTFDAHRLLAWAADSDKQTALKERLFEAYMHEGKSVSDHETLVQLAQDVGLDPERAQSILSSDDFTDEARADQATAGQLGITGVPFFVIDGRIGVEGAQPPEVLLSALQKAAADAPAQISAPEAPGCGTDGCKV